MPLCAIRGCQIENERFYYAVQITNSKIVLQTANTGLRNAPCKISGESICIELNALDCWETSDSPPHMILLEKM